MISFLYKIRKYDTHVMMHLMHTHDGRRLYMCVCVCVFEFVVDVTQQVPEPVSYKNQVTSHQLSSSEADQSESPFSVFLIMSLPTLIIPFLQMSFLIKHSIHSPAHDYCSIVFHSAYLPLSSY